MMPASGPPQQDQDDDHIRRWLRRLALILLVLLGSFGCMLLAAQIALLDMVKDSIERDVRSRVAVDYSGGEYRPAPLDPQVIEDIKEDLETVRPTGSAQVVTVVPIAQIPPVTPTAVAQITPTPSASATPLSPTATSAPSATEQPEPTDTPQPTVTEIPEPSETPVPSATSLPPTDTPTLPSPTFTDIPTVPPPPDTFTPPPPPTNTFTPSPTPSDTFTPTPTLAPPTVLAITPVATVQGDVGDPPFDVTIIGQGFFQPVTAWLGENISIGVTDASVTTINGTLSPNIPVGVYALTVQNGDGQSGNLSPAFTVYPRPHPTTTLESDVVFVTTFGPAAPPSKGDHDHVQIIFFAVPDAPDDSLYIRIFDADTGDTYDKADDPLLPVFNTVMTYTVRGGPGPAYSEADARSYEPGLNGIRSGTFITQRVVGSDGTLDNDWLTLPLRRNQGELVGGSRVFKLVVQGASGDDGNWYHVALSSAPDDNVEVGSARVFAFSWCVVLPTPGDQVAFYPYVPFDANDVTQYNFDFDVSSGAGITLMTPRRNLSVSLPGLSGQGTSAFEQFFCFAGERATTWTARFTSGDFPGTDNYFSLWFFDDKGTSLAVFTAPTLPPPPSW